MYDNNGRGFFCFDITTIVYEQGSLLINAVSDRYKELDLFLCSVIDGSEGLFKVLFKIGDKAVIYEQSDIVVLDEVVDKVYIYIEVTKDMKEVYPCIKHQISNKNLRWGTDVETNKYRFWTADGNEVNAFMRGII